MNKNDLKNTIKVLNKQQLKKPKLGRPVTQFKEISKTSQQGTKENETRATFIVSETILTKVKAIAYWDRIDIKQVVGEALQNAITKYEKSNGPIKTIPAK